MIPHRLRLVFVSATLWLTGAALAAAPETAAPPAPSELNAAAGDEGITLRWAPSAGAVDYDVYRSITQNDTRAARVASGIRATTFTSRELAPDTTYYFRVVARNAQGESSHSTEVAASTASRKPALADGAYVLSPRTAPAMRLADSGGTELQLQARQPTASAQRWHFTRDGTDYRIASDTSPRRWLVHRGEAVALDTAATGPEALWSVQAGASGVTLSAPGETARKLGTADGAQVTLQSDPATATWLVLPPVEGTDGAADPGTRFVPSGYQLVFNDEFDGDALDTAKWEPLAPYSQPHLNEELENYLPEAVTLQHGQCVLTADAHESTCSLAAKQPPPHCAGKHAWRSGAITSRGTWTAGYYEARFKLPQGQGLWPAFWLTSSKRWPPEWDILEIPHPTGLLYQYMHPTKNARLTWAEGASGNDSRYTFAEGMPNPYDGYVVYGCEVTATEVKLWVNGRLTSRWQVSQDTTDPMWVSLNLAVGGKWAGPPDQTTPLPARMEIDYVRIYQRAEAPAASPRP